MAGARGKARVASLHRWLGLALSLPLLGWIISSVAMMMVTMNAPPSGLAGVYELNPYNSVDMALDSARITPDALLKRLAAEHGITRIYTLRLIARGPELWYVVKPTPSALAMTFDAMTGERLDPLSDERLGIVANEAIAGSTFASIEDGPEYNRYYDVRRVPAARASVIGAHPATLVLSRDEGRTLRRLDAASGQFEWWYKTFHVNQFSDHLVLWTTFLLTAASAVIVLTVFGYQLFVWRRAPAAATAPQSRARSLHRKVGVVAGGLLVLEMGAGIYMWICFGPLEDPFRGKSSINKAWAAGITTDRPLADPRTVLRAAANTDTASPRPVQAIEWRRLGDSDAWVVMRRLNEPGEVYDAATRARVERLTVEEAGVIARQEVVGEPTYFYVGESSQLWMDLNRPVRAYRFRFDDPDKSDVYIAMTDGQVLQRRSAFWRRFGPFLDLHMFSITGLKWLDMTLLGLFEIGVVAAVITGWMMHFGGKRAAEGSAA